MSTTEDRLEILIGRLLDGEISPAEQRLLDQELERNGRARELLERMRRLHECGCEAVGQELAAGAEADEVFERAWCRSRGPVPRRVVRIGGLLRFPLGLAAGFILGLILHFVPINAVKPPSDAGKGSWVAEDTAAGVGDRMEDSSVLERRVPNQITHEVEWYGFTDPAGNQWLVEGLREGMVKPASYHGGL